MNDDRDRSGLTDRFRGAFGRRTGDTALPDPEDVSQRAALDASLRRELHAAVDRVMDAYAAAPGNRESLRGELYATLDAVVVAHGTGQSTATPPSTVEGTVDRIGEIVRSTLRGGKTNARSEDSIVSRLTPYVTPLLLRIANDERAMQQVGRRLERIVGRYVDRETAHHVTDVILRVARDAARRRSDGRRG